jgi:chromosome segregation ATPase
MRRHSWWSVLGAVLLFAAAGWSQQQAPAQQPPPASPDQQAQSSAAAPPQQGSLAEAARRAREQKKEAAKPAKVFDNDNLPAQGGINTVGRTSEQSAAAEAPAAAGEEKPGQAAPGKNDEKAWRDKFATLHAKLEKDKADLDVMQRELSVLDVQYYPDPVKAMQQSVTRDDINEKTAKIEAKKKDIEADQQAIADAEEALRKSGGDSGWAR